MWFPKKYHYNPKTCTTMKVDLNVCAASKVVSMNACPAKISQSSCGILYRGG